ncbi:MAG: DUF4011 domain-containing protein [Clostridiales bacterium]|nr:DUF4011 domain-containing protein [Clostridiales bacterium]
MIYLDEEKNKDEKLRISLYRLKEELQEKYYNFETGRKPTICTDDAIEGLVKYKPKSLDDMSKIKGIGDNFIENYGKEFLELILKSTDTNKVELNDKEKILLGKLENRLVNINRRNRLLYSSKVNKDYGIDIFKIIDNIEEFKEFIIERKNYYYKLLSIEEFEDEKLKVLLKISRQVNKIITDTGNNELYIAYPFVQGKMENEDFNVKAPLMLFPVEIIRDSKTISLKNDFSREIIYNTNLILANNKFNGENELLPNNEVEEIDEDYIEDMIEFYSDNKFYISKEEFKPEKFLENKASEFPRYKNGELEIKGYMILGIYSMYVTSMFSDFHKMIDNSEITKLIKELLNGYENNETDTSYQEISESKHKIDSIEKDIYYINELDFSQENVLNEIKKTDSLVVQGPPGTGKSQTITSLIIQSILENKKILMVSEKKTALDVIYSRLGELSRFALLIDDVENKDLFYKQLEKLLNMEDINTLIDKEDLLSIHNNPEEAKMKLKSYINNIDEEIEKLNKIATQIYVTNFFGTSYYKLYNECKKININNENEYELYNFTNKYLTNIINKAKYNELKEIKNFFDNESNINTIFNYLKIVSKNPYIINIKSNLTELDLIELKKDLEQLNLFQLEYKEYNFIKKIFNKAKLDSEVSLIVEKYFTIEFSKDLKAQILKNVEYIINFISNDYEMFFANKYLYDKLNLLGVDYSNIIYKIKEKVEESKSLIEINSYLYNLILYNKIVEFEKNNTLVLNYVNNFEDIIKNIRRNIINKKEYTKRLAFLNLIISMLKLNDNGKLSKIEEMCNRKRKMSINKFMNKYRLEMLDSVRIWLMTPEVVSDIFPFDKNMFDLLIFDEASQLYVEKAIPSIYRTKKVVIAGDKQQLKPSSLGKGRILDEVDDDESDDGFLEYESLLDAANYKYKHTMLNYHYRSRYSELISFSNYAFYKGKLLVSASPKESKDRPIERIMVENGRWIDKKNIAEAEEVVKLVKNIIASRKSNETIGVITFNISQMNLIEEYLEKEKIRDEQFAITMNNEEKRTENGENIGFFVKNIESVQGDERDIIIFCIGYAKNENNRVAINFGWLNQDGGENRLNVAISRAKNKIYVVTSIEPEELIVDNTKNNGPKLFKDYLKYAKAISENNEELAESILLSLLDSTESEDNQLTYDSVFEEEVCNRLLEEGYNISTQYGVGGYRVDIVVKSKDGREILLGIECDGRLYHSSKFARERDYHRQKYLESRGWKIYRIWSTNWWKNPEAEISKLKKYINSIEE